MKKFDKDKYIKNIIKRNKNQIDKLIRDCERYFIYCYDKGDRMQWIFNAHSEDENVVKHVLEHFEGRGYLIDNPDGTFITIVHQFSVNDYNNRNELAKK